jgi:hypothetical protein
MKLMDGFIKEVYLENIRLNISANKTRSEDVAGPDRLRDIGTSGRMM